MTDAPIDRLMDEITKLKSERNQWRDRASKMEERLAENQKLFSEIRAMLLSVSEGLEKLKKM